MEEEYSTKISKFKGHWVIKIPTGGGFYLTMGLSKAKAVLDHLEEIQNFVEKYEGKSKKK